MVWNASFAPGDGQVPCRERLALLEPRRRIGPLCALPVQRHGNAARPSRLPGLQAAHRRFRSGMAGSRAQPRPDRKRARGLKACDAARQAMNAWLAVPAPALARDNAVAAGSLDSEIQRAGNVTRALHGIWISSLS